MIDKRGQVISIVGFFVIVLAVFILAVLLISFTNTILNPVALEIGNVSEQAGASVTAVNDSMNKWWDIFIALLFFLNVIVLMFSSFMVDIHPAFLLIYVIAVFFLIIFGGNMLTAVGDLWSDTGSFANGVAEMPLTVWLLNHYTTVILAIVILSGVVMYAKFKYGSGDGGQY
tara:strand:- start:313 stop:828 length:516 start_codon:yes stop_codon:yes gene_type:complete